VTYTLLHRDDDAIPNFRGRFLKLREALGVTGFGINEINLPAGSEGPEHDEAEFDEEEVYVGLDGAGTITVDGDDLDFGPGMYLRVAPGCTRQVKAGSDGLRFLVVGGVVGARRGRPQL
jgi:uncharacterized cupin superfamily protein